jgi:biopolymer transport protein ExbB/TolQ
MQRAMTEDKARLESGLTILATIGAKGTASINTVAAPVGEALIMTDSIMAFNEFNQYGSID